MKFLTSLILILAISSFNIAKEDEELFPWDIGDLIDDPVTEDEIFSKTKKYVKTGHFSTQKKLTKFLGLRLPMFKKQRKH
jgi:hypothetical protein